MLLSLFLFLFQSCQTPEIAPCNFQQVEGDYFRIEANTNQDFMRFCKKVEVFGIPVYAVSEVEDRKLLHAANLLAQYLDNDEDEQVDDPNILRAMLDNQAALVMWKKQRDLRGNFSGSVQDLGNDETVLINGENGQFDAALEEVLHLVTHVGWANAYPNAFGEEKGSRLTDAMDIARGGRFEKVPKNYPEEAWYSYDDKTCDYNCQVTEYVYWALTSYLGAQDFAGRCQQIHHEWKLCDKQQLIAKDKAIVVLFLGNSFILPTVLPDGTYRR